MRAVIFSRRLDGDQGRAVAKLNKHENLIQKIETEEEFISVLERKEGKYLFIDLLESCAYAALVPRLQPLFPAYRTICFDSFFDDDLKFDLQIGPSFDGTTTHKKGLSDLKYFVFPEELRCLAPTKDATTEVRSVLITLGGSDPFRATPSIARALCGAFPKLHFTVVIGPGFMPAERQELKELAGQYGNVECAVEPEHLGHLYMVSDFAITSGGQTKFETALFGIPSFILANNLQEEELSKEFAALAGCVFLGRADQVDRIHLREELARLISESVRLNEMSRKSRQLLDIYGGERVVDYIKQNLP